MYLQRHGLSLVLRYCLLLSVVASGSSCHQRIQAPQKSGAKNQTNSAKTKATVAEDPRATLRKMFDRYRQCQTYSDQTTVATTVKRAEKEFQDTTKLTIDFVRPNKLRLLLNRDDYQLIVTANESSLFARVKSSLTKDFSGQVVQSQLREDLTVRDLYVATECRFGGQAEQTASLLWSLPIDLSFTQLGLLLTQQEFDEVFPEESKVVQLPNEKINGVNYLVIRVTSADEKNSFVFRIDPETFLLQRLDFPKEADDQRQETSVFSQISEVNLNDEIADDVFRIQLARSETPVRFFIEPPLPLPTDLFGKRLPGFELATLQGDIEKSEYFAQKQVVLVWFDRHPESKLVLSQLQRLADDFDELSDRIIFRAIITEPVTEFSNQQVRQLLDDWKVTIPVNRDLQAVGRDRFGVSSAPTCVILGSDQSVHLFEVGANPQIGETVRIVLQSLLQGVNVGAGVVRRFQSEMKDFQSQLASARVIRSAPDAMQDVVFPDKTQPSKLSIQYGWRNDQLPSPGNLAVIEKGDTHVIYAVVAPNTIAELNTSGTRINQKKLALGNEDSISVLRHFATKQGKSFFYAFTPMGRKAYVLNERLEVILKYPASDRDHSGIQDVLLADLDNSQTPELYVAFGDPIGVHQVNLNGKRNWSSRKVFGVQSLTVDRARFGRLLTCGELGAITPIFVNGQVDRGIPIGKRTIHRLTSADSKIVRPSEFVGLSLTIAGRLIAIGLDRQLNEKWSYGLPNGIYQSPVEIVTASRVLSKLATCWVFVGPDGSIHLVADDGSFFDSFQFGERVDGLSTYRENDQAFIVVSSTSGVQQIQVMRK